MHVVTTVCDKDGAMSTLPPAEDTPDNKLKRVGVQQTFDTEEEAKACYSEEKPATLFLFTADCHIKRRTWTNSTLLQGDASRAFSKFVHEGSMIGPGSRDLIIGGDLFDNNRPSSQDVLDVANVTTTMHRTFYIRGNHDNVNPSYLEALNEPDDEYGFGQIRLLESGKEGPDGQEAWYAGFHRLSNNAYVAGISWMPSDSQFIETLKAVVDLWNKRRKEDDILYLVLHCSFKHLLGFDGAYQLDVDMIKQICGNARIDILVGHIHTRDTTVYNEVGAYIHSPGSLYPLSSDKMGVPCYGSIINADTGRIIDVPSDVRKYVTVNIAEIEDLSAYLAENKLEPEDWRWLPTFVNIIVPENYDKQIVLPESDKFVFKIDKRLAARQVTVQSTNNVYTIQDAVREELQQEANKEMVLEMAEELLASDDPVGTLDEWLTFWQVRKAPC